LKKKQAWARRKRGTPSQIGKAFPFSTPRTPMQVKTFKENLRKLKPVGKGSPFQTPYPLSTQEEQQVTEEQPEMVEEFVELKDGTEARITKPSLTPAELYAKVKTAASGVSEAINGLLVRAGLRKKQKPKFEEIEIESNA
jgi:hypothetical protein